MIFILFAVSALSSLAIAAKKIEANWKDRKMIQDLNIMIKHSEGQPTQNLNNKEHNQPIVDLFVLVLFLILIIGSVFGYVTHVNGSTSDHIKSFWVGWFGNIFLRTIFPVFVTAFHLKHFRSFILKTFCSLWVKILPENHIFPV